MTGKGFAKAASSGASSGVGGDAAGKQGDGMMEAVMYVPFDFVKVRSSTCCFGILLHDWRGSEKQPPLSLRSSGEGSQGMKRETAMYLCSISSHGTYVVLCQDKPVLLPMHIPCFAPACVVPCDQ